MTGNSTTVLVIGGAGIQNLFVVRELVKNPSFHVKLLSRDTHTEDCLSLSTLSNVTLLQGSCYDEETLLSAFQGVDACFVNTNGFAIGEKSEVYWGIRMYEIAFRSGVRHFIYSALPYVSKKSGYNPKYRVPFVDGKAKVCEYLKAQPTDKMRWSILESGPYADYFLTSVWFPKKDSNGVHVFQMPIGPTGAMAFVSLGDLAWFARYMFEHPHEFEGNLLSVGIEHASGDMIAAAFTAVTGLPARFEPLDLVEFIKRYPEKKIGLEGSPGFDDPTLQTIAGHFLPWYTIWSESGGNKGLWTRDYDRLDKIHPGRCKTVAQWMRSVGYAPEAKPAILKTGLN